MSTVTGSKKEKVRVFEMLLASPGMQENCKINLLVSRQNALVLCRLIEVGLMGEKQIFEDEILGALPGGIVADFKGIHEEVLKRAGLSDFYEKLKAL